MLSLLDNATLEDGPEGGSDRGSATREVGIERKGERRKGKEETGTHKIKNANPTIPLLTPHAGSHFPCVAGSSGAGAASAGVSSLPISIPMPLIMRRVAVSTLPATSPSEGAAGAAFALGASAAGVAGAVEGDDGEAGTVCPLNAATAAIAASHKMVYKRSRAAKA